MGGGGTLHELGWPLAGLGGDARVTRWGEEGNGGSGVRMGLPSWSRGGRTWFLADALALARQKGESWVWVVVVWTL